MQRWAITLAALLFSANAAAEGRVQAELPDDTGLTDDAAAEAVGNPTPLSMMHWLDPAQDRAALVTKLPTQDVGRGKSVLIELGRVGFRSPALLGGYAAELGLSCNACHTAGRAERHFLLPPLSPRAGQIDISHALFNGDGDDEQDNPRPIRDLTRAVSPYGTTNPTDDLRAYIDHKITVGFAGRPPDPLVLDAITAYVTALTDGTTTPSAYAHESPDKQLARHYLDAIARAFSVGQQTINEKQAGASLMTINAIRAELGRLHERLDPQDPARALLAAHATKLTEVTTKIAERDWFNAARQLQRIRLALSEDTTPILSRTDLTYFNYDWLAGAIDPSVREPLEEDAGTDSRPEPDAAAQPNATDQ